MLLFICFSVLWFNSKKAFYFVGASNLCSSFYDLVFYKPRFEIQYYIWTQYLSHAVHLSCHYFLLEVNLYYLLSACYKVWVSIFVCCHASHAVIAAFDKKYLIKTAVHSNCGLSKVHLGYLIGKQLSAVHGLQFASICDSH